jgi:hypothetical protein
MKTFIALVILLSATNSLVAETLYKCNNNDFEITVRGSSLPFEDDINIDDHDFIRLMFDNDISVEVAEGEKSYIYNIVASITDGAGQDSFQAFSRSESSLTPLEMTTDFYYEHEGGCLDGSVYSKAQRRWVNFDACWDESADNRMMCEF